MINLRHFLATPFLIASLVADWVAFHCWYICWAIAGEDPEADDGKEGA